MKTTAELKSELELLLAERKQCKIDIQKGEVAEKRIKELQPGWLEHGEIRLKMQEIEDSKYPVWSTYSLIIERIVSVTDRWISIKKDGAEQEIRRYKIDTGRKERARDDTCNIDPKKALEIWRKWHG